MNTSFGTLRNSGRGSRSAVAALLIPMALGCVASPDVADDAVRIMVEGGVTIVENPGLHVADTLSWSIGAEPVVKIGVIEGAPEYMIGRLAGAYYRTDGVGPAEAAYGRLVSARSEMHRRPGANMSIGEPYPQAFTAVHGDRFYYADAERFEVRVYAPDGALERVIRVAADPPRHRRDEIFPAIPAERDTDDPRVIASRQHYREIIGSMRIPDPLPHFSDMTVDDSGRIWLREYRPVTTDGSMPRWFIFDTDGRLRWSLRSPPGMVRHPVPWARHDLQIGEDFVLTSVRDEYGVESVVMYRLEK
ncbi:hypothetical protein BH23GEM9_BH23GEM9_09440 [soil metagenome]